MKRGAWVLLGTLMASGVAAHAEPLRLQISLSKPQFVEHEEIVVKASLSNTGLYLEPNVEPAAVIGGSLGYDLERLENGSWVQIYRSQWRENVRRVLYNRKDLGPAEELTSSCELTQFGRAVGEMEDLPAGHYRLEACYNAAHSFNGKNSERQLASHPVEFEIVPAEGDDARCWKKYEEIGYSSDRMRQLEELAKDCGRGLYRSVFGYEVYWGMFFLEHDRVKVIAQLRGLRNDLSAEAGDFLAIDEDQELRKLDRQVERFDLLANSQLAYARSQLRYLCINKRPASRRAACKEFLREDKRYLKQEALEVRLQSRDR